jgi:hypothetical protein
MAGKNLLHLDPKNEVPKLWTVMDEVDGELACRSCADGAVWLRAVGQGQRERWLCAGQRLGGVRGAAVCPAPTGFLQAGAWSSITHLFPLMLLSFNDFFEGVSPTIRQAPAFAYRPAAAAAAAAAAPAAPWPAPRRPRYQAAAPRAWEHMRRTQRAPALACRGAPACHPPPAAQMPAATHATPPSGQAADVGA